MFSNFWKEFLFPPKCPGCGNVHDMGGYGFCARCVKTVVPVREPSCKRCGKKLKSAEEEYCSECRSIRHFFRQNKAAVVYSGAAKQAMYAFKYGNARWIGDYFAKKLVEEHREWIRLRRPARIVPVPMYRKKERERGYNQAEILATKLAKWIRHYCNEMEIPVVRAVERTIPTLPQKQLTHEVRRKNLKKAFKMNENVVELESVYSDRETASFSCVLLVDDIYTTGATLDAISELLIRAKYTKEVVCMTAVVGQNL